VALVLAALVVILIIWILLGQVRAPALRSALATSWLWWPPRRRLCRPAGGDRVDADREGWPSGTAFAAPRPRDKVGNRVFLAEPIAQCLKVDKRPMPALLVVAMHHHFVPNADR
jgi:hypothetical protein